MTVTSSLPKKMHPGMIIIFRIHPVLRIPWAWITEITHVKEPYYFVDEQRFGPYRFWHHLHVFIPKNDGIEMHDIVHYGLKFGLLGRLMHRYRVRRLLEDIFDHRREQLRRRWPEHSTSGAVCSFESAESAARS